MPGAVYLGAEKVGGLHSRQGSSGSGSTRGEAPRAKTVAPRDGGEVNG